MLSALKNSHVRAWDAWDISSVILVTLSIEFIYACPFLITRCHRRETANCKFDRLLLRMRRIARNRIWGMNITISAKSFVTNAKMSHTHEIWRKSSIILDKGRKKRNCWRAIFQLSNKKIKICAITWDTIVLMYRIGYIDFISIVYNKFLWNFI